MKLVCLLVTAAQIGVIGAVSALVAPTVFRALEAPSAGAFLRYLFPRYFVAAVVLAVVAATIAALGGYWGSALVLAADAVCFATARVLIPWINAAKDRGDSRFAKLHRVSTLLNGVGLLFAIIALGMLIQG